MLDRERKIGYVRIASLEHGVADDVEAAVTALKAAGMRGLILDLRWSPGGFLTEAVLVARLFLKESPIAKVQSRLADQSQPYSAQSDGPFINFPLVVLVNGETMGGSELIVAALQDNKRALVVGQRTFGKASVQTLLSVAIPDTGLKLTSGSFVRPSGKALHRFPESKLSDDWGVRPEDKHAIPLTPDLSRQMRDWYLLQALRPSSCNDVLPLDDPETDVQQRAALRAVVDLLK
jgi:carboxyl-terminal processing protease